MRSMTLGVGDVEASRKEETLKDSDFIDNEGNQNPGMTLINQSDNPNEPSSVIQTRREKFFNQEETEERLEDIEKINQVIKNIESTGRLSQVSMESVINDLPKGYDYNFLPLKSYSLAPSKLHVDDTLKKLSIAIKVYCNDDTV